MKAWQRLVIFGFMVTWGFYAYWFHYNSYIFGKSDVDNYFKFRDENLSGIQLRHIILQAFVRTFPMQAFTVIIPFIFWFGIAWQSYDLFGEDAGFNLLFGTASIPLFFITALWSQFLSMALILSALRLKKNNNMIGFLILMALALTYLPTIYYILSFSFSAYLIASAIMPSLIGEYYFYNDWSPIASFILYSCPVLAFMAFFSRQRLSAKDRSKWLIMSLMRLGRGFIYLLMDIRIRLSIRQKAICIIWWVLIMHIFLNDFMMEYSFCSVIDGCRAFYPIF